MNKSTVRQAQQKTTRPGPAVNSKPMFFNELALRYLASHADQCSQTTFNTRIAHLSEWLLNFFGAQRLNDIRPERLQKFVLVMQSNGVHQRKIASSLVTFRLCMKFAWENKWLSDPVMSKPCLGVDEPLPMCQSFMSQSEYHDLYQDLVQETIAQTFH